VKEGNKEGIGKEGRRTGTKLRNWKGRSRKDGR